MNTPSLEELLEKVDSRYTLVVTAAKRRVRSLPKAILHPKTGPPGLFQPL